LVFFDDESGVAIDSVSTTVSMGAAIGVDLGDGEGIGFDCFGVFGCFDGVDFYLTFGKEMIYLSFEQFSLVLFCFRYAFIVRFPSLSWENLHAINARYRIGSASLNVILCFWFLRLINKI
jgi:hypothetical protein